MKNRPPLNVIARTLSNVTVDAASCCIETNYSTGSHGYGQVGWHAAARGRSVMQTVHRVAWFAAHGPIPDGMTVDHICRNRKCINVDHLRLLTNVENARNNGFAIRTHCPKGHTYDETNTRRDGRGHRRCIACANDRNAMRCAPAAA